jgi:phage gpG-like protein
MAYGLAEFAGRLLVAAAELEHHHHAALERAAVILEKEAKEVLGTYAYGWPHLAASTISRKANGDTPLLETGAMRDSIQHNSDEHEAYVGTNDPKGKWQEFGTSRGIPPRPFIGGAVEHKGKEALEAAGLEFMATLTKYL